MREVNPIKILTLSKNHLHKHKGVEYVYNSFGNLIINKDFNKCNEVVDEINKHLDLPHWIVMPILTLTASYKDIITGRKELLKDFLIKAEKEMSESQFKSTKERLA